MNSIFISYSHKDIEFVNRLKVDLKKAGLAVFEPQQAAVGSDWSEAIMDAIKSASYILVVLSPNYFASAWTQSELNFALDSESKNQSRVIPLLIQPCQPTGLIALKQWIDFTEGYKSGIERLLPVLLKSQSIDSKSSAVGEIVEGVNPEELKTLRKELKEAVELFKSKPLEPPLPEVKQASAEKLKLSCFIIMPFSDGDLNVVYEDFVKPIVEENCGLVCQRGDDVFGSNVIMDDILTSISRSDLIIADLIRKNANVFYEVGISHALGKRVLLMAQDIDDIPFDLRHRRILLYEYSPRGCKRLEASLRENIISMIEG